ncbi:hypothetical protein EJB05_37108, partial [Eragrostis curvula]
MPMQPRPCAETSRPCDPSFIRGTITMAAVARCSWLSYLEPGTLDTVADTEVATQISRMTMEESRNPSKWLPLKDIDHPGPHLQQRRTLVPPFHRGRASQIVWGKHHFLGGEPKPMQVVMVCNLFLSPLQ